jgi:hydrogenase maturation protease
MNSDPSSVLILGIGNVLWADEGFGVRAVEALHREYEFPDHVTLMDGGTQGLYLVHHVQAADVLVVFDAVDYGLPPGTLKRVEDGEVPKFLGAKKVSLHQTGFQEVLATAEILGHCPTNMLLIGVQPMELEDYGGSLRAEVKDQIGPAITMALDYLAAQGVAPTRRKQALPEGTALSGVALNMDRYERERPSAAAACRAGDARVLHSAAFEVAPRPVPVEEGALSVDVDHRNKYGPERH